MRKVRIRKPHTEATKEKMRASAKGSKRKYFLPESDIVNQLLMTKETVRSLSIRYKCSDSTIKIIFRRHTTKEQRIEAKVSKQSQTISGENSPNWRGGITPEIELIRSSAKYKKWRLAVFIRDHFTCTECGSKSGMGKTVVLNAHHIKPFALYPDERFNVGNGITLCKPCHVKKDTIRGKRVKEKMDMGH